MKARWETIKAIELVHVRLFDTNDGPKVMGIFQREADLARHPLHATLFQSPLIPNDWSICFWRTDSGNTGVKSPGGVRCAEALRSLGLVDHTVWQQPINGKSRQPNTRDLKGEGLHEILRNERYYGSEINQRMETGLKPRG
jgi:hypothetical protein